MLRSDNPVLRGSSLVDHLPHEMGRTDVATVQGVLNKTGILVVIATIAGGIAYSLVTSMPSILWISSIGAFVICLGMGFALRGNPALAKPLGAVYAAVEGAFLGAFTSVLDKVLAGILAGKAGVAAGITSLGLALPALVITLAVTLAMLALYRARIVRPTQRFKAVVGTAVVGIMIAYLAMFVLSLFGVSVPFLGLNSALQGGSAALIGLGLNAFILVIASLMLVIDFERVEQIVDAGAPRSMEWYAAFGLLVTLAWIYYEAVKMVFRLAVILGNRK